MSTQFAESVAGRESIAEPLPLQRPSVLWREPGGQTSPDEPDYFHDLNLDQVVGLITGGRDEYDLRPFFFRRLESVDDIHFRHEVFRDIEDSGTRSAIESFARSMRRMREQVSQANKLHYLHQREAWFLDAVQTYCGAIATLSEELAAAKIASRGLAAFNTYLSGYVDSAAFRSLESEAANLKAGLAQVAYAVTIRGTRVTVRKYGDEADYSAEVENTFARFKQGTVKDYRIGFTESVEINHVEAQILGLVARLFGDVFGELDGFARRHTNYLDAGMQAFDREIQFYLASAQHIERIRSDGASFCYPEEVGTLKWEC